MAGYRCPRAQRGFTLIELLVASAIFVFIGAISYPGWYNIQQIKNRTDEQMQRLDELERAWYWIANDFEQLIDRPVRDQLDSSYAAVKADEFGEALVEFSRAGWTNPAADILPGRSSLQRVAYQLEEQKLYRYYWYHLDRFDAENRQRRLLIANIENLKLRFLDNDNNWHDTWPAQSAGVSEPSTLPRVIEVNVELADLGEISRRFLVP